MKLTICDNKKAPKGDSPIFADAKIGTVPNKVLWLSILWLVIFNAAMAYAATPTVEQALNLTPVQAGVDYDRPGPQDIPKCKITAKKINGQVGWIVEGPDGAILRKFVDTNGDNVVDQWSYYKDGVEVYRDIDSNFNGKADQHRWFNTRRHALGPGSERRRNDRILEDDLRRGSNGRSGRRPGRPRRRSIRPGSALIR